MRFYHDVREPDECRVEGQRLRPALDQRSVSVNKRRNTTMTFSNSAPFTRCFVSNGVSPSMNRANGTASFYAISLIFRSRVQRKLTPRQWRLYPFAPAQGMVTERLLFRRWWPRPRRFDVFRKILALPRRSLRSFGSRLCGARWFGLWSRLRGRLLRRRLWITHKSIHRERKTRLLAVLSKPADNRLLAISDLFSRPGPI